MSSTENAVSGVHAHGPIFISYRQSDGTPYAVDLAWRMRAAGLPVWHDQTDLPPGDTRRRLEEALANGLSGAVLIATLEIANSDVVRTLEAPRLISLASVTEFALWVANAITTGGEPDYKAPDRLLELPDAPLEGVLQVSPDSEEGVRRIVETMVRNRLVRAADQIRDSGTLTIRVQTRGTPTAFERRPETLHIRLKPGATRLPSVEGLRYLQHSLPSLYEGLCAVNLDKVAITGGGHLSVALALGAAMPTTLVQRASVIDGSGEWDGPRLPALASNPRLTETRAHDGAANRDRIAVFLDLVPNGLPGPFASHLAQHGDDYAVAVRISSTAPDRNWEPEDAHDVVAETAHRIRSLRSQHGGAEVHLFLNTPFALAFLLGRLLNTVAVVVYELDDNHAYVPCLSLRDTSVGGAIEEVLLTEDNGGTDG